jgi:hypothetical protein
MRLKVLVSFGIIALLGTAVPLFALGNRLTEAWDEFQLENYSKAKTIFTAVVSDRNGASNDDIMQAKFGLALLSRYQTPGADIAKSIEQYKALLAEIKADNKLVPAVHLFLGRAYGQLTPPDIESSRKEFTQVVEKYPGSTEEYEATIELALCNLHSPTKENIQKAIAILEAELVKSPKNPLAGVMHQYCGKLGMTIEDYKLGRDHLMAAVDFGLPNMKNLAGFLFQIAYTSERQLDDPKTAIVYYKRFVKEILSDGRKYYCEQRIAALEQGMKQGKKGTR